MKPSTIKAIEKRRRDLRNGRSVREESRHQWQLDKDGGAWSPIRNRMSFCRNPHAQDGAPRIDGTHSS